MFSLVNKHEEFFDFLVTNGEYFHKGTLMVKEVLQDPKKLERCAKQAEKIEHLADGLTHEEAAKKKQVFITPIDREDRKINRLESEADTIYRAIISDLFDGTHEAVEIIRWKEIMETMEETADQAERVGNLIKEVVMKYA